MKSLAEPVSQGLYDPSFEHDACGMGFIAHLRGERSHAVIGNALRLLSNLDHRSAVGSDAGSSDGSGILLQLPHAFLRAATAKSGIGLPSAGNYGVGMFFLPRGEELRNVVERQVEAIVRADGCRVLGWRDVPVNSRQIGASAARTCPSIRQLFLAPQGVELDVNEASRFERVLYVIRRRIEKVVEETYIASLSSRTIVYKGLVRPTHLAGFYKDLADPLVESGLAVVHSRFSTNTFPSWSRAHPYRYLCHNGEINTLRGNLRSMSIHEE